jgi:ketosteroid isomerase-like protein
MSREDVETIRRFFAALTAEDFEALFAFFDPDVEWSPMEGTYKGPDGVVAAMVEWIEPWDEHDITATEVVEAHDQVLAVLHLTARGTASGMEIDQDFFQIYTVREGKIVRMVEFVDRDKALDAAGLRDQGPN